MVFNIKGRKEEEEDDEEEEEISRFPPHFRPRRWCRFVVEGACCPYGSRCTFAHHESEFSGFASDSVLGPFLGAPARPRGRLNLLAARGCLEIPQVQFLDK